MLFSDDFVALEPGWGEADDTVGVSEGALTVNLPENMLRRRLYLGRRFDDADLRIRIVQKTGAGDQPAGADFWGVYNFNYYVALLQSDGNACVDEDEHFVRPRTTVIDARDSISSVNSPIPGLSDQTNPF